MMLFMTRLTVTKKEGDDEDSHYMMTMTMITRTMTMMKLKTHHSGFPSLGSHLLKGGWSCRLGEENAHKVAHPFILKRSATRMGFDGFSAPSNKIFIRLASPPPLCNKISE